MIKKFLLIVVFILVLGVVSAQECGQEVSLTSREPFKYGGHTIEVREVPEYGTCDYIVDGKLGYIHASNISKTKDDLRITLLQAFQGPGAKEWSGYIYNECTFVLNGNDIIVFNQTQTMAGYDGFSQISYEGRTIQFLGSDQTATKCGFDVDGEVLWITEGSTKIVNHITLEVLESRVEDEMNILWRDTSKDTCNFELNLCSCGGFECPDCIDTDWGSSYYIKGQTTGSNGITFEDHCRQDNGKLVESYCNGEFTNFIDYECPEGCVDGACYRSKPNTCVDTDGSDNPQVKGEIVSVRQSSSGEYIEWLYEDTCDGDSVLEMYCVSDRLGGMGPQSKRIQCAYGCEDGACISPEQACEGTACGLTDIELKSFDRDQSSEVPKFKAQVCVHGPYSMRDLQQETGILGLPWKYMIYDQYGSKHEHNSIASSAISYTKDSDCSWMYFFLEDNHNSIFNNMNMISFYVDPDNLIEETNEENNFLKYVDTTDTDHDMVIDAEDNCPNNYNPGQTDCDHDGIGDQCDDSECSCNDPDGFWGISTKTKTTYNGVVKEDYCVDSDTVMEYGCDVHKENPLISNQRYCSDGCVDGACIKIEKACEFDTTDITCENIRACNAGYIYMQTNYMRGADIDIQSFELDNYDCILKSSDGLVPDIRVLLYCEDLPSEVHSNFTMIYYTGDSGLRMRAFGTINTESQDCGGCTDTDDQNYEVRGTCMDSYGRKLEDSCYSDQKVEEWHCLYEIECRSELVNCPNGCKDGMCLTPQEGCTDSDGGLQKDVFGKTTGVYAGQEFSREDYCINQENGRYLSVMEQFCNPEPSGEVYPDAKPVPCPNGCVDGACQTSCGDYICIPGEIGNCEDCSNNIGILHDIGDHPFNYAEWNGLEHMNTYDIHYTGATVKIEEYVVIRDAIDRFNDLLAVKHYITQVDGQTVYSIGSTTLWQSDNKIIRVIKTRDTTVLNEITGNAVESMYMQDLRDVRQRLYIKPVEAPTPIQKTSVVSAYLSKFRSTYMKYPVCGDGICESLEACEQDCSECKDINVDPGAREECITRGGSWVTNENLEGCPLPPVCLGGSRNGIYDTITILMKIDKMQDVIHRLRGRFVILEKYYRDNRNYVLADSYAYGISELDYLDEEIEDTKLRIEEDGGVLEEEVQELVLDTRASLRSIIDRLTGD